MPKFLIRQIRSFSLFVYEISWHEAENHILGSIVWFPVLVQSSDQPEFFLNWQFWLQCHPRSHYIFRKICYSVHIQNYTFLLATLSVCSCILNAGPFNSQISIVFCFRKFPQSRFILNSQLIFFPFCYYPCLSLPINKSQTVSGIFVPSSARKRNWSIILNASIKRMCEK